MKLILASSSPRRKELLGHLKIPFEIVTKHVVEESGQQDPVEFCREIAQMKGAIIAHDWKDQDVMVVSADTIVVLDGRIYGKPSDRSMAKKFLSELSGKTHSVFTAMVIHLQVNNKKTVHSFVEESKVTFREITPDLMERYLDTGDSLDKAGAYGIQNGSLTFISRVEGDYANVVGFPLSRFIVESKKLLSSLSGKSSWLELF